MRVVVAENKPLEIRLTAEQGHTLALSGLVTAAASPYQPGLWTIRARGRVGVARVDDMEVWIHPKLPISRLLFLAGYANGHKPLGWRDEDVVGLDTAEGAVPVVARFLCHQAELALQQGPLKGYRTVEESSSILRGRLREADQLRRHHGRAIPMEIRHDDFTINVPENQILLAAIIRIAGVPRVREEHQHRLAALRAALVGVTMPERGAGPPPWHPNRLNLRYHGVLRLAEVILQATSPEHISGSLLASGFLFNLWKIFEDFVVAALAEELQARHGGLPRDYPCHLDQNRAVTMRPDLVWQVNRRPVAVVDAKYKPEKPSGYPDADLYQVLAHCTALRLPHGHLVYARGNAEPKSHVVRSSGIEIVCHALDLMLPPAQLLAQVRIIADELVASADSDQRDRWRRLINRFGLSCTEAFLAQEWRHVLLTQGMKNGEEYLAAARSGRFRRLGTRARAEIWPALAGFEAELRAEGLWTHETICVEAAQLLELAEAKPYRHIIVDEAQDLSPWQWRLLRAAVPSGPDDLFLVGDTHQRIYDHRVSLKQVGIDIARRSERLKINYRTTAEILGWSLGLLRSERIDDMNEDLETLAGCRSEVHGAPPILHGASTRSAEMEHLVSVVRSWLDGGVQPGQIGIAARSSVLVDEAVAALAGSGIPTVSLTNRAARDGEAAATTMHRMKGLEFRCVAVVGVSEHHVPAPSAVTPATDDQRSHDLDIQRERCLLFVACTRARENLVVSWRGTPSPLLPP